MPFPSSFPFILITEWLLKCKYTQLFKKNYFLDKFIERKIKLIKIYCTLHYVFLDSFFEKLRIENG